MLERIQSVIDILTNKIVDDIPVDKKSVSLDISGDVVNSESNTV